ncbi:SgcJ/EcaC family oxidoreductase [Spirosoma sp. HMF4905]|uniref:SgcJ/EcaC family oxidoreductase n=1 Tax=Spirosoma arboris TaxID=2682092 RepID=A0A7K1SLP6_9BACT|nr:SgcJ/EcaC family oxidoreductase [Spirosoma arboris]MVM34729.1 SgcJ/EcaC family oxidoreductase [Spirosoma arboris]
MKVTEEFKKEASEQSDAAAIRQVFAQLATAWDLGDANIFAECLTNDCDYVTFAGQHIVGQEANRQIHHDLFNSWALKGSSMHSSGQPSIAFLSNTIALVHSTGTIKLRFQKKPPLDRLSIQTMVLIKTDGQWKIRAFHNCRIQQPGLFQRLLMAFKRK